MAGYLWSNPDPSNVTSASVPIPQIHSSDIGSIVNAIMRAREQATQNDRQDYQAMLSGISKGVQGYAGAQMQGQQDDAANAAIYGLQYPNDPYGGFTDPSRVPDYGGTDAAKLQLEMQKIQSQRVEDQLRQAQMNQVNAHANQMWSNPTQYDTSDTSLDQRHQYLNLKDQLSAAKRDFQANTGVPDYQLNQEMDKLNSYQPGQTAFPAIGGHPAINDASQGGYKDSVLNAVAHYKDALRNMQNVGSSGSAGVRQSDVDQAAQTMKSEQGGSRYIKVATPEEAAKLPAGTIYETPDGQLYTR